MPVKRQLGKRKLNTRTDKEWGKVIVSCLQGAGTANWGKFRSVRDDERKGCDVQGRESHSETSSIFMHSLLCLQVENKIIFFGGSV